MCGTDFAAAHATPIPSVYQLSHASEDGCGSAKGSFTVFHPLQQLRDGNRTLVDLVAEVTCHRQNRIARDTRQKTVVEGFGQDRAVAKLAGNWRRRTPARRPVDKKVPGRHRNRAWQ